MKIRKFLIVITALAVFMSILGQSAAAATSGFCGDGACDSGEDRYSCPHDCGEPSYACMDGGDNDGDGLVDYPDDPGCFSRVDNDERDPMPICQDGSHESISMRVYFNMVENFGGGDAARRVYVGTGSGYYREGEEIALVRDGVALKDSSVNMDVPGMAIQRGDGYIFVALYGKHIPAEDKEISSSVITFSGTSIVLSANNPSHVFERQGDGIFEPGKAGQDEYVAGRGSSSATVQSTVTTDIDSFYIYYSYTSKAAGGCQCQDGIDNDGDGMVDLQDPGCFNVQDTSELNPAIACDDGIDNDYDGMVDYPRDPGCYGPTDTTEEDAYDNFPTAYASANPTSGDEPFRVQFSGSAGGGDAPLSYRWTFGDGSSSASRDAAYTYNDPGTYTATLTVTDADGDSDTDSITIRVYESGGSDGGRPTAYASASPTSGDEPLRVQFNGDADDGDAPYSYRWTFGDGGTSGSRDPEHTYHDYGTYTATLRVTDDDGDTDTDSVTIRVYRSDEDDETPVVDISASPTSGNEPLTVRFSSDVNGGDYPYSYRWTFGDGSTSSSSDPQHMYTDEGTYTATLRVTDGDGDSDTDSVTIRVYGGTDLIPTARASASPLTGCAPMTVFFSGYATGGNVPVTYYWVFGDGTTSSLQNPGHTYSGHGIYTVVFRVTDTDGDSNTATLRINATGCGVTPPVPPPAPSDQVTVSVSPTFLNTLPCQPVTGSIRIYAGKPTDFTFEITGVPSEWLDYQKTASISGSQEVYYIVNPKEEGSRELLIKVHSPSRDFSFAVPVWMGRAESAGDQKASYGSLSGAAVSDGLTGLFTGVEEEGYAVILMAVVIALIVAVLIGYLFFLKKEREV